MLSWAGSAIRSLHWLVMMAVLLVACEAPQAPAAATNWVGVCIDVDGDGYGFQCSAGPDCDDDAAPLHDDCAPSCSAPSTGCACDDGSKSSACSLPYQLSTSGSLLCSTGTRYCRDGAWTGCEGIKSFEVPASSNLLRHALINGDAGLLTCSPCRPDCYQIEDPLSLSDGVLSSALVASPSGGLTLVRTESTEVEEPPLLDDVSCSPGVAPDVDCDGVPDSFDPYPNAAPFASDHQTIFMALGPGEAREQPFDVQFFVNTADIYFYLDMTASMEDERDNLIASLTAGNYLPDGGRNMDCADRDFDGSPDNALKNGGIAGNIACLVRDSRLGAGWFRDIPFEGPYANGIRVAPTNFEVFEHRQDITSDVAAVRNALSGFATAGNYNAPEGSMQGLWSLVTGGQLYSGWNRPGVPERSGCPANTWGYACFRQGAVPVVIHISDAPLQNGPSPASATRANYLSDCVEECSCVRETCRWGFCYCAEQSCSCGNAGRHPLNYDANVLSGLTRGSEPGYRTLTTSAEALATAENVGSVGNVLLTYAGNTEAMTSDVSFSALGSCPSGTSAWSSSSQTAPDVVFRFRVESTKTLTVSTRGSRFDTALLVKRVGSSSVLDCNDNISSSDMTSEITRSFSAGEYYAVLKGRSSRAVGWFQITIGDKTKQTTGALQAKTWLGPNGDGVGGVREALLDRGVRVISVNSSSDPYLAEQTQVLSRATNALDVDGTPLTFTINGNGTGMGAAVVDAVNLLSGNLAMDVGVVLREEPDRPLPKFGFTVEAVDRPGDLCDPPIDSDGDPARTPDTHVNCRPGAAPMFKVRFSNPAVPNQVRPNPNDPNGGYSMRLELIGDGTYVVDRIPVYIIPEAVIPTQPASSYAHAASYEQTVGATGCSGNEAPLWGELSWVATLPEGTALRWEMCSADSEATLASCTLSPLAEVQTEGRCSTDADCPMGSCSSEGLCRWVMGPACTKQQDCGSGGTCKNSRCAWPDTPIDVRAALVAGQQGRGFARVRTTLQANATGSEAPTLYEWQLNYTCSAQE